MMNVKKLIYDVIMMTHNSNLSYKRLATDIMTKYQIEFRERDFFIDLRNIPITETTKSFLKYCPFQFSSDEDGLDIRHRLYDICQTILTPNDNELISIGSGYIGKSGIFVIGMAPGFYSGDVDDLISQPFKPSFFFQNTSKLLKDGFEEKLNKIYFTNVSRIALEKAKMNASYEENYEKYWPILKQEIELLQPKRIIVLGTNAYEFLKNKGVKCEKAYHPAYFIYQGKQKESKKYYENIIKK